MTKYSNVPDPNKAASFKNKIAVIYAEGTIVMGRGNEIILVVITILMLSEKQDLIQPSRLSF